MSPTRTILFLVIALTFLLAIGSVSAVAQTAAAERENKASVSVRPPTPQELKALNDAMAVSTSEDDTDLVVVQHKNGMQSVDLKGRFQSMAVAKRSSDGSVSVKCVDSAEQGTQFLTANETAPKKHVSAKTSEEVR